MGNTEFTRQDLEMGMMEVRNDQDCYRRMVCDFGPPHGICHLYWYAYGWRADWFEAEDADGLAAVLEAAKGVQAKRVEREEYMAQMVEKFSAQTYGEDDD